MSDSSFIPAQSFPGVKVIYKKNGQGHGTTSHGAVQVERLIRNFSGYTKILVVPKTTGNTRKCISGLIRVDSYRHDTLKLN